MDAWLFDLDGVLTDTARVHAAAWKETFDEVLARRGAGLAVAVEPFDLVGDYQRFVDGKPRYDGVRDFLASRGIELPEGSPSDPPASETVCGVGNRKNEFVLHRLGAGAVAAFPGSVTFVEAVRRTGVPTAVVSASENCMAVLRSAGITGLFDVVVDGRVAAGHHLAGKPAPDTFLWAAGALGVPAARAAVVEDALAGVQAGQAGEFGLVVGVARSVSPAQLVAAGADIVVADLAELLGRVGRVDARRAGATATGPAHK
ncbi:MAG TPA: beta-phosphoglucomutase family hydrolase [Acidimicrobiales bacterium]|nr:beta-phosphoglucomutase family hydrolase [Acidimicrobiales bacterium]